MIDSLKIAQANQCKRQKSTKNCIWIKTDKILMRTSQEEDKNNGGDEAKVHHWLCRDIKDDP